VKDSGDTSALTPLKPLIGLWTHDDDVDEQERDSYARPASDLKYVLFINVGKGQI
jgi:hypothetical protein